MSLSHHKILKTREVLQLLRTGNARYDMEVCTLDDKRNTGGKRLFLKQVTLASTDQEVKEVIDRDLVNVAEAAPVTNSKNPHHRANATINIRLLNNDVITIHPDLIEKFNGARVTV